jgi:hypothetical protein
MNLLRSLLSRRDIWKRIALERLTEPLHLNAAAAAVALFGGTRLKIQFDLLVRPQHAYGVLAAADLARERGLARATVIELGVGSGTGLLNLCELATAVTRITGVHLDVVGFDTGAGLPAPRDFRDHPELYKEGWFPMEREKLERSLPANGRIVFGDLHETMAPFVASLQRSAPIGFVSLDVDFYSSSVLALGILTGQPDCYLPQFPLYVDDLALPTNTSFAGELLAISEFNRDQPLRKIDRDWNLVHGRVFKHAEWLTHMRKVHVLDHAERNDLRKPTRLAVAPNPYLERRS